MADNFLNPVLRDQQLTEIDHALDLLWCIVVPSIWFTIEFVDSFHYFAVRIAFFKSGAPCASVSYHSTGVVKLNANGIIVEIPYALPITLTSVPGDGIEWHELGDRPIASNDYMRRDLAPGNS